MFMRFTIRTGALLVALACIPATQARADGYISPWAGVNFGSDSTIKNGRGAFGVNAGAMGGGTVGGELSFGYSPSFFGTSDDFGNNTVVDLMANVIVGIPFGGQHGAGFRPFVTAGVGLIRTQIDGGTVFDVAASNNDFGWNAGVGAMGYINNHVGLRADLKYLRNFNGDTISTLDLGSLHYWRAAVGVVLR
jgi:hypothetical protein